MTAPLSAEAFMQAEALLEGMMSKEFLIYLKMDDPWFQYLNSRSEALLKQMENWANDKTDTNET
ncbi:hypothetical protein [Spirosoma sp. KNUC1025]|uniref:hypothetical protein n=1 Tax=Spirosoma sp. KNUC1025 TaxID=2894082 RepID=UPI0038656CD4|nr:hypothetical protein LN737_19310 [Spirosoma sp. KNUC1025]